MKNLCPFEEEIVINKNNLSSELKTHLSTCKSCSYAIKISRNLTQLALSQEKENIRIPGYKLILLKADMQKSDNKNEKFYVFQLFFKVLLSLIAGYGIFKEVLSSSGGNLPLVSKIYNVISPFIHSLSPEIVFIFGGGIITVLMLVFYEKILSEN